MLPCGVVQCVIYDIQCLPVEEVNSLIRVRFQPRHIQTVGEELAVA